MENIITRILEIEQKCAEEIRQAEQESAGKIEAHRQMIEEKKAGEFSEILTAGNARAAKAVEEANKRLESEALNAAREYETRFQDPTLREEIREKVISLLLAS